MGRERVVEVERVGSYGDGKGMCMEECVSSVELWNVKCDYIFNHNHWASKSDGKEFICPSSYLATRRIYKHLNVP